MMLKIITAIITLLIIKPEPLLCQSLEAVKSFAYNLQDLKIKDLAESPFDLLIIDYSLDGSDSSALNSSDIAQMLAGKKNRMVISYLSIGEAEDYRFYFKKSWLRANKKRACKIELSNFSPEWLGSVNKSYCGNYKTRFWHRSWQKILFGRSDGLNKSYLDRIIDAGFQGVYLDIIDGYEYWLSNSRGNQLRKSAARDMAILVERIAHYAKVVKGKSNFIIIPQNGSNLLIDLNEAWKNRYLNSIDAIGAEDTFYFGELSEDNNYDPQGQAISNLMKFKNAGKRVFAIDYLLDKNKVIDFQSRTCALGFIPQVSSRKLDSLKTQILQGCEVT